MIEARNLFAIQSRLQKGNKTIPIKAIEKNYILSWVLVGIAKSKMYEYAVFKGGTALKKFYFPDYRFSEDLDFTIIKEPRIEELRKMLHEVYAFVLKNSNISLALRNEEKHKNGYTVLINSSGPLGADMKRRQIKTDFTINEKLLNRPVVKTLLREYNEYVDIPNDIKLNVYPLEEIFVEKYISISDAGRNEPRDIYDLWYLVSNKCLAFEQLGEQIKEKSIYKGISCSNIIETLNRKENNYRSLWEARLAQHMTELPHFDKVYRELKKHLRPLNRLLIK